MKRAKRKKIKRIVKASVVALVMTALSAGIYVSQLKQVRVDYLGEIVTFRTMSKTVAQAFKEKNIIITENLVVSKDLNSKLEKNNNISIDAPLILAMIEKEKEEAKLASMPKEEVAPQPVELAPAVTEAPTVTQPVEQKPEEKETDTTNKKSETKTSRGTTAKPMVWGEDVTPTSEGVIQTATGETLEYSKVVRSEATAYCACYSCCGKTPSNKYYGITKTGTRAKAGTVAVDPRVIPLGSRLYIEGLNGARNYGYAVAEDTGGAIKGNIVDLFFENHSDTIKWGRQQVNVYVLK